jgi:hypothetical protein
MWLNSNSLAANYRKERFRRGVAGIRRADQRIRTEERMLLATPGTFDPVGHGLTREAAERLARNWSALLLNGLVLIVAGVLIFSIDWSVESLATFIGALFVFEGIWLMSASALDGRAANIVIGLLYLCGHHDHRLAPVPGSSCSGSSSARG